MVYRKRNYRKRKGAPRPYRKVYKRRAVQAKARKMTKFTNVKKDLYYYKKKRIGIQVDLTASPTGALQFQLSDIPNVSELTTMFDQYMIYGVAVEFRLIYSPDSTGNVASSIYPNLYVRRDYDDNNTESSLQIMQSNKSKRVVLYPNRSRKFYIKPSVLTAVSNGLNTYINRPVWKQWLDCSDTSVPHLGLKFACDTMGAALPSNTRHLQIDYTYYVACKSTR